ncbi:MAG: DUF255 domain-containing protein [Gammaproteobacteria bacterium]|nr:DUF255 domain-containing protein [Gammaproteobacteria bacterium]
MKLPLFISVTLLFSSHLLATESVESSQNEAESKTISFAPRSEKLTRQIEQALDSKGSAYQPRTEHLQKDGSPIYTNRLILEDSPYLIQHAHNPVDWYPWGPEAFAVAKRENKPIFLSIGYSTCHWCHVMERESFESSRIASILNQNFIAIKVDRERRPDVDKTYMQAVTMIAGNGGWPMSSFLTAEGKPFYGGTYFPPEVFADLLLRVTDIWKNQQPRLFKQAQQISDELKRLNNQQASAGQLSNNTVKYATSRAIATHDSLQGGFGQAPKFPQEPLLFLLLSESERNADREALNTIETTLDAMSQGGIYDQIGGGFHRYSTDNEWLVPHFEKMLYNQAHLGRVYLLAWRLTGKQTYKRVATQTLDYVLRDMTSPEGAFYSATDADSEGEEGVFFLWTTEQIRHSLSKQDAEFAIELFGISENGNFESSNILHLPTALEQVADQYHISLDKLGSRIDRIRNQLYQAREAREHPLRDEKILTAWNGMMISTLAQAGMILGEPRYTEAALQAAEFIWDHNRLNHGELYRVHLDGNSSIAAQQEDYAYFAEGLLHLYDVTGSKHWLNRAKEIADNMSTLFWDDKAGGFYMNRGDEQLTSIGRPRDRGTDNAVPSGSSVALRVLQMLNSRLADFKYGEQANAILAVLANAIKQRPTNYGYMLTGVTDLRNGELSAQRYVARGGVRAIARQLTAQQVVIDLSIPPGWHINSNQPLQKGLIPTTISIDAAKTGWQMNKVSYPESITTTLGFQKEALSLYQGKVQIHLEVDNRNAESLVIPIELGIQACNDRICLPPEKVALRLPMMTN